MTGLLSAARALRHHWLLAIAITVNLAIAAPVGAVRYDNAVCETEDGEAIEACCETCWFFCHCDIDEEGGGDDGDGGDDGSGGGGSN